ncbi:hypothetical protein WUBG_08998 [Wuchereria bancrofti]|uniref:Uncharacterized protein n=1 Tax=Wuchereria bancrofti TaxID=6293 RepID=J9EY60_WUCBA|nr:hypothetical protein WUBG_08998 [Wuchereria bancrofti]
MKNRWNVLYYGGYVFRQLGTTNHLQKYIIVTAVLFVHRYAIMSHREPRDDEEEEEENNICPRQKMFHYPFNPNIPTKKKKKRKFPLLSCPPFGIWQLLSVLIRNKLYLVFQ